MLEATRLTRAGRLIEATALLQRVLRGGTVPDSVRPDRRGRAALAGRGARIIDLTPDTVELTDPRNRRRTGQASATGAAAGRPACAGQRPCRTCRQALRGFLDRVKRIHPEPGRRAGQALSGARARRRTGRRPVPGSLLRQPAGSRAYKLYVPSGYRGQAVPLVVMLHGCTQSPDDFAAGTRMNVLAEEHSCWSPIPRRPPPPMPQKCWNWFSPGDQQRDQGEPSLIAGITRQVMRDYAVDPERVYVAGLSAGGAAAAIMGTAYPDLYAAVGVHSGLACGAARDLPSAFAAMRQGEAVPAPRPARSGGPGAVRPDHRVPRGQRQHGASAQRRPGHRAGQGAAAATCGPRCSRPGARRTCLQPHPPRRRATARAVLEQWVVHGGGHAWSGGSPAGSYTDPARARCLAGDAALLPRSTAIRKLRGMFSLTSSLPGSGGARPDHCCPLWEGVHLSNG